MGAADCRVIQVYVYSSTCFDEQMQRRIIRSMLIVDSGVLKLVGAPSPVPAAVAYLEKHPTLPVLRAAVSAAVWCCALPVLRAAVRECGAVLWCCAVLCSAVLLRCCLLLCCCCVCETTGCVAMHCCCYGVGCVVFMPHCPCVLSCMSQQAIAQLVVLFRLCMLRSTQRLVQCKLSEYSRMVRRLCTLIVYIESAH